ncbi:sugar kinase [Maliponia aquimaris]|uniref:2-dehydro-3-deoxygluconokinase n=1 Tax=Maliponia aquimaris TaxID=1673631 RepID=A0A238KAT3_9RHOB|nr:sugar kinase [Maliponia aquimaris]SMX39066.1 2-dehydro-3-deoxygluconokinase [Maliponia aquimaris]
MTAPPRRILCIGECMAELAPLDAPGDYRLGFAGDSFNTAWYLRQLRPGLEVDYLSAIGGDAISDRMARFMADAGIGTAHVARVPGRSVGMYMISLSAGERSFSYWRDTSAARLLAEDPAALDRAMSGADLVYFSGITLAILSEAARDRLLHALRAARGQGATIAFDPNLRPRLWRGSAEMCAAIMQGATVSDVVLPSFEDEAAYFGDADPRATADRYAAAGARSVVVKNGPDPVHVLHDGRHQEVVVAPVPRVVDTTSAGDSFNAGVLVDWGSPLPMAKRIERAAAVTAQVIGGKGALVPLDKTPLSNDWTMP